VLLAIWLLLWLAVPPLLKWQAQQRLSTLLGRTVTIGQVQFAPWSLELTLRDVAIAGASGNAAPLFHAERLYADADWRSLFRFAPVIAAIEVDAPRVNLARTAPGRYDIDDIVERLKPAPQAEPSSPARFALYNVQVRDGALAFDDKPVGRRHAIDKLLLRLPFLSTLPSQVEITVEPRLAFTFDGASFDTGAQTTPFAPDRETSMTLKMGDFDLAIVKPYLPPEVPVDLQRGRVQADLSLRFALRDGSSPSMSLRGAVKVSDLALAERGGAALASWRTLQVALDDVRPLERKAALGTVRFEGFDVSLTRDAQGHLNLLQLVPPRDAAPVAGAAGAASAASAAAAVPQQSQAAWQLTVRALELGDARVRWHDALTEPDATWSLDGIDAKVAPITWPATEPATLALKAQLHEAGREAAAAMLAVQGSATPTQASVGVRVDEADLGVLAPYLALLIKPRVEGRAALDTRIDWAAQPEALTVHLANATIDGLRVVDAQQRARSGERKARDALAWKHAELADVQLDVPARKLAIGRIALVDPQSVLERRADGGLNVVQWAQPAPAAAAAPTPGAAAVREAATTQWQVALTEFTVAGGQLLWRDDAVPGGTADDPVRLDVHAIRATVNGLSWPVATAQAQVQLSAQVADPAAQREQRRVRGGSIDWKGRVVAQPLAVRGALRVERFPIHALERYATGGLNASLQRGQLQWRGDVALRQRP
ncbi:MAG TPA: DUF748 domain-containing protein, partial [Burkholderiaceae bacterium]|nr:DUF748 domain-containing protein [Burkholderiaceae bacterium]